MAADARPLHGVRVLDLSRLLPGPAMTWYLQGLGAEVIRVEDPVVGDWMRHVPPYLADGHGAWFGAVNAGKRSVALDLRDQQGLLRFKQLLGTADVLVEGFRPGVMFRLGLDPAALCRDHPRLVVASLTGFGQTGGWEEEPGHDLGYCALAGALALGTRRGGVPDLPGLQVADLCGGALTGALQIAAALYGRERTGAGAWLDISMTAGTLALLAPVLAAAGAGHVAQAGGEALTGGIASYGLYSCQDGRVLAFAPIEPKFQERFAAALQLAGLPRVALERAELQALFATRPRDHWVALLRDCCVEAMLEVDELADHPLHRARRSIVDTQLGPRIVPPFPGAEAEVHLAAPALGADTEAVFAALPPIR
jgi:alpha-methylacyl-CoA racemase